MDKKELSVRLSKLKEVENPKVELEQYGLLSDIAAEVLWFAYMNGDIKGKIIADLGCDNGILGIGCLLLNAKKVYFVDVDKESLEIAKENLKDKRKGVFVCKDVRDFNKRVDVVVENPPFGVQKKHADKVFLEKAMELGDVVYSFHKIESRKFIKNLANEKGFKVKAIMKFNLPLKPSQKFHKERVYIVKVGCWRLIKNFKRFV